MTANGAIRISMAVGEVGHRMLLCPCCQAVANGQYTPVTSPSASTLQPCFTTGSDLGREMDSIEVEPDDFPRPVWAQWFRFEPPYTRLPWPSKREISPSRRCCRQGKPPHAAVLVLLDCWLTNGADGSPHRIRDKCRPRRARSIPSFFCVA